MNCKAKALSLMLILILLFSLAAQPASAEGSALAVPVGSILSFDIAVDPNEDEAPVYAAADDSFSDFESYDGLESSEDGFVITGDNSSSFEMIPTDYALSLIDHRFDDYYRQELSGSVSMDQLLIPEAELILTPPTGYYVADLTLNGVSVRPLLTKAHASTQGSEISLWFAELLTADRSGLDSDYVGGYTDGNYILHVHFSKCAEESPLIRYDSGVLGYDGQLTYDENTFYSDGFMVSPLLEEVETYAAAYGLQFDGFLLTYDYGPGVPVSAGEYLFPYSSLTLTAQWRQADVIPTPEPTPEPIPEWTPEPTIDPAITPIPAPIVVPTVEPSYEPVVIPTLEPTPEPTPESTPEPTPLILPRIIIKPDDVSKVYDGTPLTAESVSVDGNLNGFTVQNVKVDGSLTNPGFVQSDVIYMEMLDPDGQQVSPQLILMAVNSGTIQVQSGTVTVMKRPLTVTAISGTLTTQGEIKTASELSTADKMFVNGYKADGLLSEHELAGNFVTGSSRESFETGIDLSRLRVRIRNSDWDVTDFYDITAVPGYITINNISPTPTPTPTVSNYEVTITPKSYTWTYDGMEHSLNEYTSTALADGDRISRVSFKPSSVITNVGERANEILSVEIVSSFGTPVSQGKYTVRYAPGILSVVKRDLTVTAISGNLTANGEEKIAAQLSNPYEGFTNGFKAEGLVNGHRLIGNFVIGSGRTSFQTYIDTNNLRIVDAYGADVTANYNIRTVSGMVNISAPQQTSVSLTLTAKSGSWTYDGNPHSLNEYDVTGLTDGDQIDRVSFKSTSVITNVGSQANEIQSVVIKSAAGAVVDNSKYNIRFIPGTLTVTKFPLTLTAVSDSKVYDGKALNNKNVKATALANSSHKLSADYEIYDVRGNTIKNGPVDVGVYTKEISNVKILSGNQDVTANYEITTIDGTLTITGSSTASSSARGNVDDSNAAYYGSTFTIRSEAPYSEFQYLLIDGQKVSSENYSVKEGSTVITLKASYIQTLKAGNHSYSIVSSSRTSDGKFTVGKAPKTGDESRVGLWIGILIAAALAAGATVYILRRGKKPPRNTPPRQKGNNSKSSSQNHVSSTTAHRTVTTTSHPSSPKSDGPSSDSTDEEELEETVTTDDILNEDLFREHSSPSEEKDPTQSLLSDFHIDLDEFRD